MDNGNTRILYLFWIRLILLLSIGFGVHFFVNSKLGLDKYSTDLVMSYIINGILTALIFTGLIFLKKKYNDQLGFLYLVGSFIKFIVFFIVFYPHFNEDLVITKIEFSVFFVPYLIGLILETIELSIVLNTIDER